MNYFASYFDSPRPNPAKSRRLPSHQQRRQPSIFIIDSFHHLRPSTPPAGRKGVSQPRLQYLRPRRLFFSTACSTQTFLVSVTAFLPSLLPLPTKTHPPCPPGCDGNPPLPEVIRSCWGKRHPPPQPTGDDLPDNLEVVRDYHESGVQRFRTFRRASLPILRCCTNYRSIPVFCIVCRTNDPVTVFTDSTHTYFAGKTNKHSMVLMREEEEGGRRSSFQLSNQHSQAPAATEQTANCPGVTTLPSYPAQNDPPHLARDAAVIQTHSPARQVFFSIPAKHEKLTNMILVTTN